MIAGVLSRIDDWINPIVVKELRQAVHSRLAVMVLLLFLALQLLILGVPLLFSTAQSVGGLDDYQLGRGIFMALHFTLLGTCAVLVPLYSGARVALERAGSSVDLFYISALRPVSIVGGKFLSSILLVLLIFSACAPFLTFTYLLRGLDIPTILFVMCVDFLVAIGAVQFAIFVGSFQVSVVFKFILGALSLIGLFYLFGITFFVTAEMVGRPNIAFDSWEFLGRFATGSLAWLGFVGVVFVWTVSLVSPPSSNRVLPLRVYGLFAWAVGLVAAFLWANWRSQSLPLVYWAVVMVPCLCVQLLISVNERERWAPRMARTIPRFVPLRPIAFVFYTGSAGGVLYSLGLIALTLALAWGLPEVYTTWRPEPGGETVLRVTLVGALYATAFLLVGMGLRRLAFQSQARFLQYTWAFGVGLFVVGFSLPLLIAFMVSSQPWQFLSNNPEVSVTNPFAGMWEVGNWGYASRGWYFEYAVAMVGTAAGVGFAVNVPFFLMQMSRFHPPPKPMTVELAEE